MTKTKAITQALRQARKRHAAYFVVREPDEAGEPDYHVASEFDLDTWFQGISEQNIIFCTDDR